jgi:hypothetical protein
MVGLKIPINSQKSITILTIICILSSSSSFMLVQIYFLWEAFFWENAILSVS